MYSHHNSHSPSRTPIVRSISDTHPISRSPSPPEVVHTTTSNDGSASASHHIRMEETYPISHGASLLHELRRRWEKPVATVVRFGGGVEVDSGTQSASSEFGITSGQRSLKNEDDHVHTIHAHHRANGGGLGGHERREANWTRGATGSQGSTRKASASDLSGGTSVSTVHGSTSTFHGDEEDCSSSVHGSFHGEEGIYSEETPRKRKCLVCDDGASGYHYGVSSCEACKAFFKRTIQGNIEYACPASSTCVIDKRRRKACQACRYKKCLDVGMLKEGVRLDRVRGGRQKYRRANNGEPIMVQSNVPQPSSRKSSQVPEVTNLISALVACEPETSLANVTDRFDSCVKLQTVLCDLADRDLVGIIGWAKQIPGFSDLPLNDQMHLLQTTWCEILLFSLCFRSADAHPRTLLFTEDFPVGEQMAREAGFDEVHTKACRLVENLCDLRVKREEYVLLKCIILLNGGCLLESVVARNSLRDTIVQSLHQFVNGTSRAGNLMLLLPHLRLLDGLAKQYWLMIKSEGKISMHKLFLEMLESAHQLM